MTEIDAVSDKAETPAVKATNSAEGGVGVFGACKTGHGVRGDSDSSKGVVGTSKTFQGVYGHSDKNAGVVGESAEWVGVYGKSFHKTAGIGVMGDAAKGPNVSGNGTGVLGVSTGGHGVEGTSVGSKGVVGTSVEFQGVYGHSDKNAGVVGESATWVGVYARSLAVDGGICVMGDAAAGNGSSGAGTGVVGVSTSGTGIKAASDSGEALHAETKSATVAAVAVFNNNPESESAALYAKKEGTAGHAGWFEGNVHITKDCTVEGDVKFLGGGDVAEQFEVVGEVDAGPGCVVVLAGDDTVRISDQPYDRRVAGIVSGAGTYRPALVLDHQSGRNRRPLALTGKVWCLVEADSGPIGLGDLLTSSSIPGHAMRASEPGRAFGAVVGKALAGLLEGRGLIPVLVALQ
jgi:hypothetical protein